MPADRLRITARIVDAESGETKAEAKADGALDHVFDLQDRSWSQFSDALGMGRPGASSRRSVGDTSSLAAYHAFTEGRVKLEALDSALVPAAIADFERAMALDPALCRRARRASRTLASGSTKRRAHGTSPTARCWRGRSITCAARSSSNATSPKRTRRWRFCS